MSRRLPEEFEGKEIVPLCIAAKLNEAKKIEEILDGANIDYTFEITPFTKMSVFSILFGGIKEGILFLVLSGQHEFCRNLLKEAGLESLIVE
ncbi:MAG: hypothetical protein HZA07_08305 [Nitrospirae bacterium]|nr:hypothetical protein [Nitrospirota bacterium]